MTIFALTFLAMLLCIGVSFLSSGSESAVISANRYELRQRHEEGDHHAGKDLQLLSHARRLISSILIVNNLSNVLMVLLFKLLLDEASAGRLGEPAIGFVRWDEIVVILVLTPLIVLFTEVLPKSLFRAKATVWIQILRPFLFLILYLFSPIVFLMDGLVRLVLLPFGGSGEGQLPRMTRGDVLSLLHPLAEPDDTPETGDAATAATQSAPQEDREPMEVPSFMRDPDERLLIRNIIELERSQVGEIMQPLIGLEAVHLGHITLPEFLEMARRSGYSRFPAYRYRIVNLVGYIDVYDVIRDATGKTSLEDFLKPAHYVPATKRVDDLLQEFLAIRINNAAVVDEYGGCCGWVTREDILEEIVGELEDELDAPTPLVREEENGAYLIEGRISVEDLNEVLGTRLDDLDCDTFGGIVMKEMGRIPKTGDEITIEDWRMRVVEMDGMRVNLVRVWPQK